MHTVPENHITDSIHTQPSGNVAQRTDTQTAFTANSTNNSQCVLYY